MTTAGRPPPPPHPDWNPAYVPGAGRGRAGDDRTVATPGGIPSPSCRRRRRRRRRCCCCCPDQTARVRPPVRVWSPTGEATRPCQPVRAMVTRVSASAAVGALLVVTICVIHCAEGSRVHFDESFGGGWEPVSPLSSFRRPWSQFRPAPSRAARPSHGRARSSRVRPHCDRACQLEKFKAKPVCEQRPRNAGRRCGEQLVRYSYVPDTHSCVPFLYGGCRGNANNFMTYQQCRDSCKMGGAQRAVPTPKTFGKTHRSGGRRQRPRQDSRQWSRHGSRHGSRRGSSGLRPTRGDTRIHFGVGPRRLAGRREPPTSGVAPRFGGGRRPQPEVDEKPGPETGVAPRRGIIFPGPTAESRPQQPQQQRRPQRTKTRGACLRQPRQTGWPCSDVTIRYSYLSASNSCVPFEFKGCGGTSNNFNTFSECSDLCKVAPGGTGGPGVRPRGGNRQCRLPWRAGSCRGNGPVMRYFYNDRRAACEMVLYSGCGGNANRFSSRHTCERTCLLG